MPSRDEIKAFVRLHFKERAYDHPARDEDLGVVSLGYDPEAHEKMVRAFADRYDIADAARITYQGVARPILSVTTRTASPRQRLLIVSGIHGNEQAGIVSVPDILENFDPTCPIALCVLTPVNPVGAAEFSRFNGDGYDINRDFLRFRTQEARVVRQTFDEFRPDFVLSLHEGPQDAAFMFANAAVDSALATRLLAALEEGGTVLATKDYFGLALRTPGLSASSPFQRTVLRLWEATFKMQAVNAFAAARGIPEITLETGWRNADGDARIKSHVDLALALAKELAS